MTMQSSTPTCIVLSRQPLPEKPEARGKELDLAVSLIGSMSEDWQPEAFHDTYTERVLKLIEDKKAGRKVTVEPPPAEPTRVVDLFEALSRSVESSRARRKGREPAKSVGKTNGRKSRRPDLSELSKAELDRMARELGIKGRSKMSRAELEKAVGEAAPGARQAS